MLLPLRDFSKLAGGCQGIAGVFAEKTDRCHARLVGSTVLSDVHEDLDFADDVPRGEANCSSVGLGSKQVPDLVKGGGCLDEGEHLTGHLDLRAGY